MKRPPCALSRALAALSVPLLAFALLRHRDPPARPDVEGDAYGRPERLLALVEGLAPYRGEQTFAQLYALMEAVRLARGSGRRMVEPSLVFQPRNSTHYELGGGDADGPPALLGTRAEPISRFFDAGALARYADRWVPAPPEYDLFLDWAPLDEGSGPPDVRALASEPAPPGEPAALRFLLSHLRDRDLLPAAPRRLALRYRRGWLAGTSPNWNAFGLGYWSARAAFRFSRDVVDEAEGLVRERLGSPGPYLAVHWRRGDRALLRDAPLLFQLGEPARLARRINAILAERGLERTYVLTNSGSDEATRALLGAIRGRAVASAAPADWREHGRASLVDAAVGAGADYFLASPYSYRLTSSVSRWIVEERILLGKDGAHEYAG